MKASSIKSLILTFALSGAMIPAFAQFNTSNFLNLDYSTSNGTAVSGSGPINGGVYNGVAGGGIGPGGLVDGDGSAVPINTFVANSTGGSGSTFGWGGPTGDPLGQDYFFLTNDDSNTQNLPGVGTVGSFRRFTIFNATGATNGLDVIQVMNITFIGSGNQVGQGMSILLTQNSGDLSDSVAGQLFDGTYNANNTITFNSVSPTINGGNTELEFWLYTDTGASATVALNGIQLQIIPEPATYAMAFGLGAIVFVAMRRRKA